MMVDASSSPPGSLPDAVGWLAGVLTGQVATIVAVLAVAAVGLLMLGGRVPVRRGATVVIGCFVLFSAATIADGILAGAGGARPVEPQALPAPPPAYTSTAPRPTASDPYAGAAVPAQR